ncbi:DNA repair protein RecO [Candidatus Bealeia paramacronuclearis]|uniref:DNA repair protein RecO n=1 Tax=Candidatus Bealeia paramacronuclearis TaxID=1921001 RepID=A0ABZ2C599_9PROT|nr:DNA repair protein RecO [Candidatus Bealeia paramacronuclearis]
MEWRDEAIVLYTRPMGERSHLVSLLTRERGKENGAVRASKKDVSLLEIGTQVNARWKARLETQLGYLTLEMIHPTSVLLLDDALGLRLLQCASVLTYMSIPQGHAYPALYEVFFRFLRGLSCTSPNRHSELVSGSHKKMLKQVQHNKAEHSALSQLQAFVHFEMYLLQELGFGLDLKKCAVTGSTEDLVAVSPKTGRAVSSGPAKPYQSRLLPLPTFLTSVNDDFPPISEILKALDLTGYFLERYLLSSLSLEMPKIRGELKRFVHRFGPKFEETYCAS